MMGHQRGAHKARKAQAGGKRRCNFETNLLKRTKGTENSFNAVHSGNLGKKCSSYKPLGHIGRW